MRTFLHLTCLVAVVMLLGLPTGPAASLSVGDLPGETNWYFHADFDEMRDSPAGRDLYAWIDKEVFAEIRDETGVDLAEELEQMTAFSTDGNGAIMVMDGRFTRETRDKAIAAAAMAHRFDTLKSNGKTFYYVVGDGEHRRDNVELSGIDNEIFFSFDVPGKLVLCAQREQMEDLLANDGRITGKRGHDGALFVLTAERTLVQAGLNTDSLAGEGDGGFDSNILRNTRQLAVMVADIAGNIAVEAQLLANEPEMAESLASIVRGLIALQAFSDDMDPKVSGLLQGTRVDVNGEQLKISVALAPGTLAAMLDEA